MKLNELYDPLVRTGIFQAIFNQYPSIKWLDEYNITELDIDFIFNHSGEKTLSPLALKLSESFNLDDALVKLSSIITNKFLDNWNRIYEAYTTEYKALENYDLKELEKVKSKIKNTVSSGSGVYGFNSNDAVKQNEVESSSVTEGAKDDNERELTRHGNIGVTTSQQMLQSELDLRRYHFYESVMNDIASVLCLKCY